MQIPFDKKKKSTSRKLFYRYTHMRARLFMTFCCSKRLETIHMPIIWRWLNINYGTFIQGMIMQS